MKPAVVMLAALVLLGGWTRAEACSCIETPRTPGLSPEKAREEERTIARQQIGDQLPRAIAVFSAEVVSVDTFTVRFKLDKAWKGRLPAEFSMKTGATKEPDGTVGVNSCMYVFVKGTKYVVFGFGMSLDDMTASLCTRTSALNHYADMTIAVLDEMVPVLPAKIQK